MVGLIVSIVIFIVIALKVNKRLTGSQVVHIWFFTIAFQLIFDLYVALKLQGYWYFTENIDWQSILVYILLVPPVNIIFLNFYPLKKSWSKQILYLLYWDIGIMSYECFTLLPEPWGYFHYGWWSYWHSIILNPIILLLLVGFYKWILKLDTKPEVIKPKVI